MSHQKVQSSYTCPENQNSQSVRLEAEVEAEVAVPEVAALEEAEEVAQAAHAGQQAAVQRVDRWREEVEFSRSQLIRAK